MSGLNMTHQTTFLHFSKTAVMTWFRFSDKANYTDLELCGSEQLGAIGRRSFVQLKDHPLCHIHSVDTQ